MEENYVAYWANIPAEVRYDDRIPPNAKLLYGEIEALKHREGYCYATNDYFAQIYKTTPRNIRRLLSSLAKYGYIIMRLVKDDAGTVVGRHIYTVIPSPVILPNEVPIGEDKNVPPGGTKMSDPPDKNVLHNKTDNNKKKTSISPKREGAESELLAWAEKTAPGNRELADRLLEFSAGRKNPISPGRAVTLLTNKLQRYSGGNPAVMLAMLDNAIEHGWTSVYELSDEDKAALQLEQHAESGGDCEWL